MRNSWRSIYERYKAMTILIISCLSVYELLLLDIMLFTTQNANVLVLSSLGSLRSININVVITLLLLSPVSAKPVVNSVSATSNDLDLDDLSLTLYSDRNFRGNDKLLTIT